MFHAWSIISLHRYRRGRNWFQFPGRSNRARAGSRAVDLGGPRVHQGESKFEIKHKSHCFQKSKLVDWGGQACQLERPGPPAPPLAPALNRTVLPTARHRCEVFALPRRNAAEMGPATSYTLGRNTASIMKI